MVDSAALHDKVLFCFVNTIVTHMQIHYFHKAIKYCHNFYRKTRISKHINKIQSYLKKLTCVNILYITFCETKSTEIIYIM